MTTHLPLREIIKPLIIDPAAYRVSPGHGAELGHRSTRIPPPYESKDAYEHHLARTAAELAKLQAILAAGQDHAVLVVLQAMDAGGKDGTIKHVFSGLNPQGCTVTSFKRPSRDEALHDFLWRTTVCLPPRGEIAIFNRSYYEEVVTARVHPELLRAEHVMPRAGLWQSRFDAINAMERSLVHEGTRIVKLFLHISKEEQARRLLARIDNQAKTWKFDEQDLAERERWDDHQSAYDACLTATSTKAAPWYVIPADDKPSARLMVGAIVLAAMQRLALRMPEIGPEARDKLQAMRARLIKPGS